ncbi:MAG: UDP-glucose 4-epimerase [Chloroflexota bacterium]|nr:UDP-glucose 4-epimerase [Chloroflexota bacterium]
MANWLVTGGAGFIGSHLTDALIARGDRVRVLDDLSTGDRANLPDSVDLIVGDAADPAALDQALDGVDGCFHLAAIASVQRGVEEWVATHRANLTATISIFDAIRRSGRCVPVVYASSAAVYGNGGAAPIDESSDRQPLSAYGADKLGCELHARVAGHVHGIPAAGLRFFNVYGPRQDPRSPYSGVISIFCNRIRAGQPVTIFGTGRQTRDFVHVADVVAALLAAMTHADATAPVFNVCTGRGTTVRTLAETIAQLCARPLEARSERARPGEIEHSVGNPSRAQAGLGFVARRNLQDGLADVLAWMNGTAAEA